MQGGGRLWSSSRPASATFIMGRAVAGAREAGHGPRPATVAFSGPVACCAMSAGAVKAGARQVPASVAPTQTVATLVTGWDP